MPRKRLPGARERRKRQNAEAQRAYRTRQKQKVWNLEQMAAAAWSSRDLSVDRQQTQLEISPISSATGSSTNQDLRHCVTPASFTTSEIYQCLLASPKKETAKCFKIVVREDFTIRDIVKYGLIAMGYAMNPSLFDRASSLSSCSWLELVRISCGHVDMRQVVASGVSVLAQLAAPDDWPALECPVQPYPPLCTSTITLNATSFVSAMYANMRQFNLTPEELMNDEAQSWFFHGTGAETSGLVDNLSLDLAPTMVQRSLAHHPCYDLLPWPSFRSNIIKFCSTDPSLIDEDDLCLDMLSGGLRCWGSTMGSMHGRGHGAPWDSRSWEAMPWFLKKWKMLISGKNDEIERTSAWWRSLRGVDMTEA